MTLVFVAQCCVDDDLVMYLGQVMPCEGVYDDIRLPAELGPKDNSDEIQGLVLRRSMAYGASGSR